ncbi:MAG: PilN domain-containing protein [Pirellulales bacterium]|nr:PilN domain-containing protein [Pirellulales bacterium]
MADRRSSDERRTRAERRRMRDRKRDSNQRFAVIEVSGALLRVVILDHSTDDAPDKVQALSYPWREEAASLNSEKGLEEFSNALRELAAKYNLQVANVQFVLGGEYCVTKTVRGSNEYVSGELQQLEQRSRLYLMLGPGEKVTVAKSHALDARHEHAVAAVCNKKTLDTIYEAANRAAMQIDSIEPALVATSRAIGRLEGVPAEPCLLVHLDKAAVELGVCHEGRVLLDYRPGVQSTPQQLVELICTHLSRLQRHAGHQLREAPPMLNHVYLCGKESVVERAYPVFAACDQFEVERIKPTNIQATWDLADGVEDSAMVPALGSLLSTYQTWSERDAPNFMEHVLASTREPMKPILLQSAIPLAAVLLVALGLLFVNLREQSKIDVLQSQVDALAGAQTRARELRLTLGASQAKLKELNTLASKVNSLPASNVVARIGHCMPSDVWLSKMTVNEMQGVQLAGVSYLEAGVFDFVNWLERAPGFEEVALRSTQPGQSAAGPAINFNVELNLTDSDGPVEEVARNE